MHNTSSIYGWFCFSLPFSRGSPHAEVECDGVSRTSRDGNEFRRLFSGAFCLKLPSREERPPLGLRAKRAFVDSARRCT